MSKKNEEYRDKMLYRGFMSGSDDPQTGYVNKKSSHYRVNDSLRTSQLKDIGLQEGEGFIDDGYDPNYQVKHGDEEFNSKYGYSSYKGMANQTRLADKTDIEDISYLNADKKIKRQKRIRVAILFISMFALWLVVGIVVYSFMGQFNELADFGFLGTIAVFAAVGVILFILPMTIMLCKK